MHKPESIQEKETHQDHSIVEIGKNSEKSPGALGTVPKGLEKKQVKLEAREGIETILTTASLISSKILWRVLQPLEQF